MKESIINTFLIFLKRLLKINKFEIYKTDKNLATYRALRKDLGITYKDFEEEVKDVSQNLDINNYCEGPKEDKDKNRNKIFWIFGVNIFNEEVFREEIYLKFTVDEEQDEKIICWSCHTPEYTLSYPYRRGN